MKRKVFDVMRLPRLRIDRSYWKDIAEISCFRSWDLEGLYVENCLVEYSDDVDVFEELRFTIIRCKVLPNVSLCGIFSECIIFSFSLNMRIWF